MTKPFTRLLLLFLCLAHGEKGFTQIATEIDSLKKTADTTRSDIIKTDAFTALCFDYFLSEPDSGLYYGKMALDLARKAGYIKGEVHALNGIAAVYSETGNADKSLKNLLEAVRICEENHFINGLENTLGNMGSFYGEIGDYKQAIHYYLASIDIAGKNNITGNHVGIYHSFLGAAYNEIGMGDSALLYAEKGYEILKKNNAEPNYADAFNVLGDVYLNRPGGAAAALKYYYPALDYARGYRRGDVIASVSLKIAQSFNKSGKADSTLLYARASLAAAEEIQSRKLVKDAGEFLAAWWRGRHNTDSALKYLTIVMNAKDSLYTYEKIKNVKDLQFSEHVREQELEAQNQALKNRTRMIILSGVIFIFMLILIALWRNNRLKQRAYNLLATEKAATEAQKEKADRALSELRATQSQLVQAEKMASLGELTAGIAHEIQNPLNFVNNFSELNTELLAELATELESGNTAEAISIAGDLRENEQRISQHGKRAEAIVKAMLQHSQSRTGAKEPADINKLADEYLRLAYHGALAKDKSFAAALHTDFDVNTGMVSVVPQDIGRVLLNIISNAFWAVSEKKKQSGADYEPAVSVSTKKINQYIEIRVSDNGSGVPGKIIDKIFQPFFTTKPTGQGTGLGLSLAYDIVKAHGGELKVETKEGEGAVFVIMLPAGNN
jgi:two-component system, NtrC family, sensor kinase